VRLSSILDPGRIVLDVGTGSKHDVLARLADAISASRPDLDRAAILAELDRREAESSTAIADGIAIPHARPQIAEPIAAFGRSKSGIDFDSLDGRPTSLLFVLLSPLSSSSVHVAWLAHIARVLSDPATRLRLMHAETREQVLDIFREREIELETASAHAAKDAQ
jgi:mannitol/fructose-specific phosphotransferase system IIA component (Ntr-type)